MKILFVGNSYTYFNDMPQLLQSLAEENQKDVQAYAVTRGGRKLHQYADPSDPITQQLDAVLAEHRFSACFLQEQSILPIRDYDSFLEGLTCVLKKLGDNGPRRILYATWGRKPGSKTLEDNGWTNSGMTQGLREAYSRAAEQLDAEVSNVGLCFYRVLSGHPEIELYNPDLSHPSYAGSCLAALCHYHTLFGEFPTNTGSLQLTNGEVEVFRASICK